ncbi:phage tail protein [Streptomyces sp. NPDC053367]|uniref:phage tail protein n=1 Tax=Streptomyces sp. NPDC053367 TaxID=3365700 RepID=UPI0037CE5E3D
MAEPRSSYLRHLPAVLWEDDQAAPDISLGSMLCLFEKILTGIPDGEPIVHTQRSDMRDDTHLHVSIAETVEHLHRLYDPWRTPERFLPWLASWVALRFPELQGEPLWDEYQQRKATSEISRIHRRRGLRSGLATFLDLYSVGRVRPRVAVDDGTCLLTVPTDAEAQLPAALSTFRPLVEDGEVVREGLMRPWCVATGPDGSLFVGERGLPELAGVVHHRRVWRISAAGRPDLDGPVPRPLVPEMNLARTVAVAVRPETAGQPTEELFILDHSGRIFAVPAPYTAATVPELVRLPGPVFPVAMAVDDAGDLLVLDRRLSPPEAATPRIFTVRPDATPVGVSVKELDNARIAEPLSLFVERDGSLLVGDGGDQATAPEEGAGGGNLVRLVRGPQEWTHTRLLPEDNALVAPTAIARQDDGRLFVLDAGLKPFWPEFADEAFVLLRALPASVRVVETDTASVRRVTGPGSFVNPTGMVVAGDRLVICDPGPIEAIGMNENTYRPRVQPFEMSVVIHFSADQLSSDEAQRKREMNQAMGTITSIVGQYKPAHCRFIRVTRTLGE